MYSPGHLGYGCVVPGQVWYGKDCCICTGYTAAAGACHWSGEAIHVMALLSLSLSLYQSTKLYPSVLPVIFLKEHCFEMTTVSLSVCQPACQFLGFICLIPYKVNPEAHLLCFVAGVSAGDVSHTRAGLPDQQRV